LGTSFSIYGTFEKEVPSKCSGCTWIALLHPQDPHVTFLNLILLSILYDITVVVEVQSFLCIRHDCWIRISGGGWMHSMFVHAYSDDFGTHCLYCFRVAKPQAQKHFISRTGSLGKRDICVCSSRMVKMKDSLDNRARKHNAG
jgi:hypothetical protein